MFKIQSERRHKFINLCVILKFKDLLDIFKWLLHELAGTFKDCYSSLFVQMVTGMHNSYSNVIKACTHIKDTVCGLHVALHTRNI